jgi:hypothetical protein
MGCGSSSSKRKAQTVSLTPTLPGQQPAEICKSFVSSRFVVSPRVAPPTIKQWSSTGSLHTAKSMERTMSENHISADGVSKGNESPQHLSRGASPNGIRSNLASPTPSRVPTPTLLDANRARSPSPRSPRFSPKVSPRKEPTLSKIFNQISVSLHFFTLHTFITSLGVHDAPRARIVTSTHVRLYLLRFK